MKGTLSAESLPDIGDADGDGIGAIAAPALDGAIGALAIWVGIGLGAAAAAVGVALGIALGIELGVALGVGADGAAALAVCFSLVL
jgi:hypothetical protein